MSPPYVSSNAADGHLAGPSLRLTIAALQATIVVYPSLPPTALLAFRLRRWRSALSPSPTEIHPPADQPDRVPPTAKSLPPSPTKSRVRRLPSLSPSPTPIVDSISPSPTSLSTSVTALTPLPISRRLRPSPGKSSHRPRPVYGMRGTKTARCSVTEEHLGFNGKSQEYLQNVNLPAIHPKNKKKPFPIPLKKIVETGKVDKKLAQMGIEKPLEPPKNGLLVLELIAVAHDVLEAWKVLIKGLSELALIIPVYGCSCCSEVHIASSGHKIRDCLGSGNTTRKSLHTWVKGSMVDVLMPIESYHMYDPFGRRIKHETRFDYDRIPAVVELCIQAGVDMPEYPSRRRTTPVRMLGKKVIDLGGFVEEPKGSFSSGLNSLPAELDPYAVRSSQSPPASVVPRIAQETLEAYESVRKGVRRLMKKYTVKACGYCSEVHIGPWGHNAKLCGAFKHQWRDGKHGWQDAILEEVVPPNYVWHVRDINDPPLTSSLRRYYGKAPAIVEVCMHAGAKIPEKYKPMMRLDIVIPESEETRLVA